MSRHESLAVVLRRWPYSESSLVIHALTPNLGLVPMLAKGVHKLRSGKVGVLDTFALVKLSYASHDDRELHTLYDAELLDRFSGISQDVDHLTAAALLGEMAELAAPIGLASGPVFLHLVEAFQELSKGTAVPVFLVRRLLESLALLGLQPDFTLPKGAENAEALWFSVASGGLLPANSPRPEGPSHRISPATLAFFESSKEGSQGNSPQELRRAKDCLTILADFLGYHLERPPRAVATLLQASSTVTTNR